MISDHDDLIQVACAMILLCLIVILMGLGLHAAFGRTLYPGQWAQVDPAERAWFKAQKSPQTGVPCCDESDGTYAEEDLREGHYWTRFAWKRCTYQGALVPPSTPPWNGMECEDVIADWMPVPDEVVIHNPNRHGAPVVWWSVDGAKPYIRCYAPGGGV